MSVRGKRRKQKATQFYLDSSKEEACFMLCKTVNEKWQWRETDMMIKQWGKDKQKANKKTPNKSEFNRICLISILHINGRHEHKLLSLLNSCNLHFGRKIAHRRLSWLHQINWFTEKQTLYSQYGSCILKKFKKWNISYSKETEIAKLHL